jgi:hypothetical protein
VQADGTKCAAHYSNCVAQYFEYLTLSLTRALSLDGGFMIPATATFDDCDARRPQIGFLLPDSKIPVAVSSDFPMKLVYFCRFGTKIIAHVNSPFSVSASATTLFL